MTLKEKIDHLSSICKESVSIFINDHYRGSGETIRQHLEDTNNDIHKDIVTEMEKRNMMVQVIAYPRNQVGSFSYYHYDVEIAIDVIIQAVEKDIKEHGYY